MRRSQILTALLVFAALAVAMTWPQALYPHEIRAHFDPLFSIWRLAWIAHQLPRDPRHLFDTNIFYPEPLTLAYSDAILVPGLLAAPLLWAGVSGVVTYNILLLVAFLTAGLGMFVLVRRLTGNVASAYVAGIMFAFSPYRFEHYHHLELLFTFWMPLAFYCVHRAIETGRVKWGIAAGLLVVLQTLSSLYYGIFLATTLPVLALILGIGAVRTRRREGAGASRSSRDILLGPLFSLAAGAVLAGVLLVPYAMPYIASREIVGTRTTEEIQTYSAAWSDYLASPPNNAVYGWTSDFLGESERNLFPGSLIVVLALVALWPPLDRLKVAYAIVLLLALEASRGLNGFLYPWLHAYVLPYQGLRVPARWAVLACLALAVLGGFGAARLLNGFSRRSIRLVVAVGFVCVMLAEYRMQPSLERIPLPTTAPPVYVWLAGLPHALVVELPLPAPERAGEAVDALYMYFSTFHWQPMLNGYSGYMPPSYEFLLAIMKRFPSDRSIDELRYRKVDYIVLHGDMNYWGFSPPPELRQGLDSRPDLELMREFPGPFGQSRVYRLRPALR